MIGEHECTACGMLCIPGEYHPYPACVMFRQVRNGDKVRSYLHQIMNRGRELEQLGLPNTATIGQTVKAERTQSKAPE